VASHFLITLLIYTGSFWKRSFLCTVSFCIIEIFYKERPCIFEAYSVDDADPAEDFAFFFATLDLSLPRGLFSAGPLGLELPSPRSMVQSWQPDFANDLTFGSYHLGPSFMISQQCRYAKLRCKIPAKLDVA